MASSPPPHSPQDPLDLVRMEGDKQSEKTLGLKEPWGKNQGQPCGTIVMVALGKVPGAGVPG